MKKGSTQQQRSETRPALHTYFPTELLQALLSLASAEGFRLYYVGGTIRDWLMGREPHDLDLAIDRDAERFSHELVRLLPGSTYVQLGTETEEAARVVWKGLDVDISSFRGTSTTIEEDLALRDFTINSMALPVNDDGNADVLIDPLNGLHDVQAGVIRHCGGAFEADPLRLLRVYRFMATLGFEVERETQAEILRHREAIWHVSPERVRYELDLLMQTDNAAEVVWQMHRDGLLQEIIPELYAGLGVEQPGFHHLDVFHHSLQALSEIEGLIASPDGAYPGCAEDMQGYLQDSVNRSSLKWAALMHDVGKPAERRKAADDSGRMTFYGHDETGRQIFEEFGRRLRWSNRERDKVGALIAMHMHPFHLCTVRRENGLSRRAALKLCRRAGEELPGLFLLAMSDSLASKGELKPDDIEEQLVELYSEVREMYHDHIQPALNGPPLLGGRDLIDVFRLAPGPIFSEILSELQALQVEGQLKTRHEALDWVAGFLAENRPDTDDV